MEQQRVSGLRLVWTWRVSRWRARSTSHSFSRTRPALRLQFVPKVPARRKRAVKECVAPQRPATRVEQSRTHAEPEHMPRSSASTL